MLKTSFQRLEKFLPACHHKLIPKNEKVIEVWKGLLQVIHVLN